MNNNAIDASSRVDRDLKFLDPLGDKAGDSVPTVEHEKLPLIQTPSKKR